MTRIDNARTIRAPRGAELNAKSWLTEAPLRMLMNNLDPDVAERPGELVVYGGIGRAARDWESFDRIVATLKRLEADETLLVQSGKPVGVFKTHADAPRVLIANSNLVPRWANWDHFHELDRKGLMMYGQMTAGSWIYIGAQGIVQGTYETFVEAGRQHFSGNTKGKWILTGGLGGMGGAQTLAATMAGYSCIAVECQPSRIEFRLRTGYVDVKADTLDEALALLNKSLKEGKPTSIALLGNTAEILPEMRRRGIRPDLVTDQTSAHDPVNGYLPASWSLEEWFAKRESDPKAVAAAARASMARHVEAMLGWWHDGVPTVDYGNNIRQMAFEEGVKNAFDFPGFVPAYIRPLFCRGVGPFRWAALSGDPEDIYKTDAKVKELIPDNPHLHTWLDMAKDRIKFQGLPARICWVGLGDRHRLGLAFNEMVARGRTEGAHRHRPRPPRFRLRRLAEPRDRGDVRRVGRRVRLAAAECPSEHRLGRDLGVAAPWRRRRHGLLAARRHGHRLRRHGRGGQADRPRVVERPGDRRHAPRRRGYDIALACAREHQPFFDRSARHPRLRFMRHRDGGSPIGGPPTPFCITLLGWTGGATWTRRCRRDDKRTRGSVPAAALRCRAGGVYEMALAELRQGRKRTHWMWFIFPQLTGLGRSYMAALYGIASLAEARAYLAHPELGARLEAVTRAVLSHADTALRDIFGTPDDLKFRSSMTLFARASAGSSAYAEALDVFCGGAEDPGHRSAADALLTHRQRRTGRVARDQARLEQRVAGALLLTADHGEGPAHRRLAHLFRAHVDGGQRRRDVFAERDVVEAGDGDVVGDRETEGAGLEHQAAGDLIIAADHDFRPVGAEEDAGGRFLPSLQCGAVDLEHAQLEARGRRGVGQALQALRVPLRRREAGVADAAKALRRQVTTEHVGGSAAVGAHRDEVGAGRTADEDHRFAERR